MTNKFSGDDLQALWRDQSVQLAIPDMKELTMMLHQEHRQEQRRLVFLNLREVTPAIALTLWFGWNGWRTTSNAWAFFAAALLVFGVGLYLVGTSLQQGRLERGLANTTRGELERSLSQMQHRARLYRTVAWWYFLPLTVTLTLSMVAAGGDFVTATGRNFAIPAIVVYLAVCLGAGVVLYRVNRKIGRERYEPKVERLTQLIADME